MSSDVTTPWQPVNPEKLAKQFTRLGWLGFWIQLALLAIPLLLLVYVLVLRSPESAQQSEIDLSNYLSNGSLLVMVFTTLWFLRYVRVGKRIADPDRRPPRSSVERTLWVGLWASCLGIFFSMVVHFSAVGRMLFTLLSTPQTGLMLAPAPGSNPGQFISALDAVSLSALHITLYAELIVLVLSVWLLFRTTTSTVDESAAVA